MRKSEQTSEFFTTLVCWCFRWGCEFRLVNRIYSSADVGSWSKEIFMPEIVFSKGDRHVSFRAESLDELFRVIEYSHKRIFMELSVPDFQPSKKKAKQAKVKE